MHAELAQANVLRLRGERDAAEKKCLSILKRYPNEPEAHSLLGELSADKEDYPRAIEWFELALDLNPNSASDRIRLEELRAKVEEAEVVKTEQQLGLPAQTNYLPWIVGIVVLLIVIIGVAAWKAPRSAPNTLNGGVVEAPRVTTSSPSPNPGIVDAGSTGGSGSEEAAPGTGPAAFSMEDRTLLQLLQKGTYGASVESVEEDPRDKALVVTYLVNRPDEARRVGATIAKDALDRSSDSLLVTVRGVSGDQIIFVADASRPKLAEIEGESNQDFQTGNDSWISTFLQREWPNAPPAASSPATQTPPAGSTTNPPTNGAAATSTTGSAPDTSTTTAGHP